MIAASSGRPCRCKLIKNLDQASRRVVASSMCVRCDNVERGVRESLCDVVGGLERRGDVEPPSQEVSRDLLETGESADDRVVVEERVVAEVVRYQARKAEAPLL